MPNGNFVHWYKRTLRKSEYMRIFGLRHRQALKETIEPVMHDISKAQTRILVLAKARTGSTAFMELLNSHPQIEVKGEAGELLNGEMRDLPITADPDTVYAYIDEQLNAVVKKPVAAFKAFPDQLFARNLRLDDLVRQCAINAIVVVWRESIVESAVSMLIAQKTGKWHSVNDAVATERISVDPQRLNQLLHGAESNYADAFDQWPIEVHPIFVQYEQLFASDSAEWLNAQIEPVYAQLGVKPYNYARCYGKRQNPAPLEDKVTNWLELPEELRNKKLDVPAIFKRTFDKRFGLPDEVVAAVVPDREPRPPQGGWAYRVAEPYVCEASVRYVHEALAENSVSSAGVWPERLASRLRRLFGSAVAQPCCTGFASLVLALQSAGVTSGDDVVVPTFTMIAVPNAVRFVGARPVFVDCASRHDYNPDWSTIAASATLNTKAVIIAHTYGVPAVDIELIAENCRERGWTLIEDISECVGIKMATTNGPKLLGTFGDYACASMYANKMVHAGDGGFVLAKDRKRGSRLTSLTNHGFTKSFHFVHFEVAMNAKMNGLGAALACGCLDELNWIIEHRSMVASLYRKELASTPLRMMPACGVGDTPWVFGVECRSKKERTTLRQYLADRGIETRDYFFPLHLQPAFTSERDDSPLLRLPNSEQTASSGFYLPTHSNLQPDVIRNIASAVREFFDADLTTLTTMEDTVPPSLPTDHQKDCNKSKKEVMNSVEDRAIELLQQAQCCFQGEEIWDNKKVLIQDIEKYLFSSNPSTKSSISSSLAAYLDYFEATDDVEFVPIQKSLETTADSFDRAIYALNRSPQSILYLGATDSHLNQMTAAINCIEGSIESVSLHAVMYTNKECVHNKTVGKIKTTILEQNGKPLNMKTSGLSSVDLLVIDFRFATMKKLSAVWSELLKLLADQAVLLLMNVEEDHLGFLTENAPLMKAIAKKRQTRLYRLRSRQATIADSNELEWDEVQKQWNSPLPRKLQFALSPEWSHLHRNAFTCAIDELKTKMHDDGANVLFIPAVEQYICDTDDIPTKPWIGIIHGVRQYPEHFYVPDLNKLCSRKRYRPWLELCRGLFTLTSDQADYLKANLQPTYGMPIVPVKYPFTAASCTSIMPMNVAALWEASGSLNVYFIGSFDRDFDHFFEAKLPLNARKHLLVGDWQSERITVPEDVLIVERAEEEEYERILNESVVFLSLKQGGAANTTVLECIARNTPIIAPRLSSVEDYLGKDYPLFYEKDMLDFTQFLTLEKLNEASAYLRAMDKSSFSEEQFVASIEQSAVIESLPPFQSRPTSFDVTITICSYKRTHHLNQILSSLWSNQTFAGRIEIIVWNNNRARNKTVETICAEYLRDSSPKKSLQLIQSSENHYCFVRFAMPQLMHSNKLLICDDDVVPGPDFINFFMQQHARHPGDVLCVRGHYFLPHEMPYSNPHKVWTDYDRVRFADDQSPERLIHYVHADVCLIPKAALQEVASRPVPDDTFRLVDDYWMSYVLSAYFDRNLRKLQSPGNRVLNRTDDSDQIGLALHTRQDVSNARAQVYVHHMSNGWPKFIEPVAFVDEELKQRKQQSWGAHRVGININSEIAAEEIQLLKSMGVRVVRIGAVGAAEFMGLKDKKKSEEVDKVVSLIQALDSHGIDVILTLSLHYATIENWQLLAEKCAKFKNVIGYDLLHKGTRNWDKASFSDAEKAVIVDTLRPLIQAVRLWDQVTPVIIETPSTSDIAALSLLPIEKLKQLDDNLLISVFFYEPEELTYREQNRGRYEFPGSVPAGDASGDGINSIDWSGSYIGERFELIRQWTEKTGVAVFVSEMGICRDVVGADQYLSAVAAACRRFNIVGCFYAFRDPDWEAMDYELGVNFDSVYQHDATENNSLITAVKAAFKGVQGIAARDD